MREYNVILCKSNKRFAIKNKERVIRIKDYLQSIWTVRKYFLNTYGKGPLLLTGIKCLYT